jgi:hypothetical protein
MPLLSVSERKRLAGICGLFASSSDGEALNAARMANEFLRSRNLSWADVLHAAPPEPVTIPADRNWRQTTEQILYDHEMALADWETKFVQGLLRRGYAPTDRQAKVLRDIAQKVGVPEWSS